MITTTANNNCTFDSVMVPRRPAFHPCLTLVLSFLLTGAALAENLLVNPSFEANSGHALPVGWTYYSPPTPPNYFGNYWIESAVPAQAGNLYWKQWGALDLEAPTNNVAGIYQEFSSAPGSTYQASGWFYTRGSDLLGPDCRTWLEVLFLDENSDLLALYKSEDFYGATVADMWLRHDVTQACDLSSPIPSGDPFFNTYAVTGSVSQLVAPINTSSVRYRFAYLRAGNQGGSSYLDDTVLDQIVGPIPPVISDVFPLSMIFVNPADGITFTATSPSGFEIDDENIRLIVNGEDVSADLVLSGAGATRNAAYYGLASNMTYTASIRVTDAFGFSASSETHFETMWVDVPPVLYLWEAEDFDFSNRQYFNHPDLCNTAGNPNCYYGTVGVEGVDEHSGGGNNHFYRPDDPVSIGISGDLSRPNLHAAGRADYRIDPFIVDEWLHYTRDWTNGIYWVFARVATEVGYSGSLSLSMVNPDTTITDLGVFTVDSGRGWTSYDNVPLTDTNGNYAAVPLNGKTTLRVTSGGNLLPNFFMLAAAELDRPMLSNLYPTGKRPFEHTNALSFTVATVGATFPAGGIQVILDGKDVSQNLQITGTDSTSDVVFPGLQPNASHTAIIAITNSLGNGITVTNHFDTFSQDNFMVEAEDFDYDGGQFVSSGLPGYYAFLGATDGIDFQHSPAEGEAYPYRPGGVPQEIAQDHIRQLFLDWGATDYHLAWFGVNDWANYTRVYPTNRFHVYARSGGFGAYSMDLSNVVSGASTTSQTTELLGRWEAVGRDNQTHEWVRLVEPGSTVPAEVTLGGQATLRLSTETGNCHPSYFMLVAVTGVSLSATIQDNAVVISFPTLPGLNYQILHRDSLVAGEWTLLESVLGDGSVKSIVDPVTVGPRFYQLVLPAD